MFVAHYSENIVAFYEMTRFICRDMDPREINPDLVRAKLKSPEWLQANIEEYTYLCRMNDWAYWREWCRLEFGWTPEAWAAHQASQQETEENDNSPSR